MSDFLPFTRYTFRLVQEGDKFGPKRVLTNNGDGDTLEVFDNNYEGFPGMDDHGKFLARFYVSNLVEREDDLAQNGLDIHTSDANISIDPATTAEVITWCKKHDWKPHSIQN